MKRLIGLFSMMVLTLVVAPVRGEVRDDGKFFSPEAVQRANQATEQMRKELGRDLLIETYPAIPQERQSQYRPENKEQFFRAWAGERATNAHDKGVYILINRDPSYLMIRPEDSVKRSEFTDADVRSLRDQMLPLMKQKDFDAALNKAVEFVPQKLREHGTRPGTAGTETRTAPPVPGGADRSGQSTGSGGSPIPSPSGGFNFGRLILLGVVVVVGMMILRKLFGRRPGQYGPGATGGQQGYGPGGGMGGAFGGGPGYGGGGGFGRGLLGGLLGGMAGGWLQDRMSGHHNSGTAYGAPPDHSSGGGSFSDSSNDVSYTGDSGAGGSFDSGGSDFGGGGGGDSGDGGSF